MRGNNLEDVLILIQTRRKVQLQIKVTNLFFAREFIVTYKD